MKITSLGWCLAVVLTAANVGAQGTGLAVNSNPAGAQVIIVGDVQLAGVTPTRFQQPLVGQYKITIKKAGYENHTTSVLLDPSKETTVDAQLSLKTPMKAALRSLFIPGWGQQYSDRKTKGYLFTGAAIAAATAYLIIDADFQDKLDTYENVSDRYTNASSVEQRAQLQAEYIDAQHKAYDAENVRRAAIGVFAGVWALNVLDAIFFFPHTADENASSAPAKSFSVVPKSDFKTVGVQLNVKF